MVIVASSSSHPLQLDQPRVIRHEEIFSVKDLVLMIPFIGYVYDVARAFISNYLVKEEVDKDSSSDCCSVVEEVDLDLAKAC